MINLSSQSRQERRRERGRWQWNKGDLILNVSSNLQSNRYLTVFYLQNRLFIKVGCSWSRDGNYIDSGVALGWGQGGVNSISGTATCHFPPSITDFPFFTLSCCRFRLQISVKHNIDACPHYRFHEWSKCGGSAHFTLEVRNCLDPQNL